MQLPLIHIGYHKTGTSWLQKFLFKSAAAGFFTPIPNGKLSAEMAQVKPFDFDVNAYREHLAKDAFAITPPGLTPVFSAERLSGTAFYGGYDSKIHADRLRSVFDNGRILIVIREQLSMIGSIYNQTVKRSSSLTLDAFLGTRERLRPFIFDYNFYAYHRLIIYYQALFGRENVLVLPYEFFLRQPANYLKAIIDFSQPGHQIDVDALNFPYRQVVNPTVAPFAVYAGVALNHLFAPRDSFNQNSLFPLGEKSYKRLMTGLQQIGQRMPPQLDKLIIDQQKQKIRAYYEGSYRESNRETSSLIGIDLSAYGYEM